MVNNGFPGIENSRERGVIEPASPVNIPFIMPSQEGHVRAFVDHALQGDRDFRFRGIAILIGEHAQGYFLTVLPFQYPDETILLGRQVYFLAYLFRRQYFLGINIGGNDKPLDVLLHLLPRVLRTGHVVVEIDILHLDFRFEAHELLERSEVVRPIARHPEITVRIKQVYIGRDRESPINFLKNFLAVGGDRPVFVRRRIIETFQGGTGSNVSQRHDANDKPHVFPDFHGRRATPAGKLQFQHRKSDEHAGNEDEIKDILTAYQSPDGLVRPTNKGEPVHDVTHALDGLPQVTDKVQEADQRQGSQRCHDLVRSQG